MRAVQSLGALVVVVTSYAHAATMYQVTDLGDLPGGANESYGMELNGFGQVVGYSTASTGNRAFLWTPTSANAPTGTMINLGDLPGGTDSSFAYGINARGQVTGGGSAGGSGANAFLWTPTTPHASTGSMVSIGDLPGSVDFSEGGGINASGQIAGHGNGVDGERAFLWTPSSPNGSSGTMADLGELAGGGNQSWANGINAYGQVVGLSGSSQGSCGFLWTPNTPGGSTGSMIALGWLPGGTGGETSVGPINASGQVAGYSASSTGYRAFRWTPDTPNGTTGSMLDLGALPGGTTSIGLGMNDAGDVVGSSGSNAFLWTSASGMVDLNSLVLSNPSLMTLMWAYSINDAGQITGYGTTGGSTHAFLLTPVPEPSSSSLVALVAAYCFRRNRKCSRG